MASPLDMLREQEASLEQRIALADYIDSTARREHEVSEATASLKVVRSKIECEIARLHEEHEVR